MGISSVFKGMGAAGVLSLGLFGCATTRQVANATPSDGFSLGKDALSRMGGCFIVDYNFSETHPLSEGYVRDERVYDVNDNKTVMEWIYPRQYGEKFRLQHVLFALDEKGKFKEGSMLRHQAEDWEYAPASYFEYQGNSRWNKVQVAEPRGKWVRKITNLDDGLRYQCLANWEQKGTRMEWTCGDNYAPIPGRETRDMKRKDYQALMRNTRLVVFPESWLERQKNVKTVDDGKERKPLTEEVGRNWFVRVPDAQCAVAIQYAKERQAWWDLLQDTWEGVYAQVDGFFETKPTDAPPRFVKILESEERYFSRLAQDEKAREEAKKEIIQAIDAYRAQ